MTRTTTAFLFVLATLGSVTANATVIFDWATVGNPGNGPDELGYGAVSYTYRISRHEVTNAQYTEFLNAVDPTGANPKFLYSSAMSSDANGGIDFNSGAANGSKYHVKSGRDNNPVIFVSFFDAMRFTNWLQNGQGSGSTESGVYTIGNGVNEIRNPGATYFIPSENEWYKAAYHKNDGVTANYWEYPTSTDAEPFSDQPPGSGALTQFNTANFNKDDFIANGYDDGFAVTGSPIGSSTQNYLTDVGAYTASLSPYGTFDQGGNVREWNDAVEARMEGSFRVFRGGDWGTDSILLEAGWRDVIGVVPTLEFNYLGFRVASIPEPSTVLMGAMAAAGLLLMRREVS
jgi:formylglycine-generating enzyme required for sulfatase activity